MATGFQGRSCNPGTQRPYLPPSDKQESTRVTGEGDTRRTAQAPAYSLRPVTGGRGHEAVLGAPSPLSTLTAAGPASWPGRIRGVSPSLWPGPRMPPAAPLREFEGQNKESPKSSRATQKSSVIRGAAVGSPSGRSGGRGGRVTASWPSAAVSERFCTGGRSAGGTRRAPVRSREVGNKPHRERPQGRLRGHLLLGRTCPARPPSRPSPARSPARPCRPFRGRHRCRRPGAGQKWLA